MTDRDRAHKFLLTEMQWHEWEPRITLLAAEFVAIREECAAIAMERAEDRKRQSETCWPNSREIVLAKAGEAEAVARDIRRVGRYGRLILSTFNFPYGETRRR